MKCQKCNAENINEAVKCGMCGARLKHTLIFNDFTGSQQVESSIRRAQPSNSRQGQISQKTSQSQQGQNNSPRPSPSTSQHAPSLVETVLDKNIAIEEKARIFLESWQEKAKDKLDQSKKSKNKFRWFGFFLFFVFIGLPILQKVIPTIYHEVSYQIRERTRIANESAAGAEVVQDESDVATVETVASPSVELEQEIIHINEEMKMLQNATNVFFLEHHKLPSKLSDLPTTELSLIDRDVFENSEMLESGVIAHTNVENPEIQLIYHPEVSNNKIISWTCYSVGVEIEASTGCVLLPGNPFAHE